MSDLADLSLTAVADIIHSGTASAVEVTRACLARIEARQPTLNCFIAVEAEDALAAAERADAARSNGDVLGPLHGVPLAHKDMFYRAGKVCTCGSKIRREFRPDFTATVINRLEAAGAIHVGTLNMVEFAAGGTGHNDHFGDCLNPWNRDHTPLGSSSGSGAAVGGRMVYGALGSDTGGSVRLPAVASGVVGLKPSYGRVSRHGVMPRSWATDSIGPMTRIVRDCARMSAIVAGQDEQDSTTAAVAVPDYEATLENSVRGLKVGVPTNYFYDNVEPEMRAALEASLEVFRGLGADVVEVAVPDLAPAYELAQVGLRAEAAAMHEEWLRTRPDDYSIGIRSELEGGLLIPAVRYIESQRLRAPILAEFCAQVFDKIDVLHAPVTDGPTPRMDDFNPDNPERSAGIMRAQARITRPIGYMGLCALAVPCGFATNGLPVGFQLIGRPYGEARLFNLGHLYQRETDWHEMAPDL
jgi:aspartyl-tRNA(Asn)/glutamyl-tRNA(Gln) amidotransferase subunit A